MGSRLIWTAMLAAALAGCKDKKQPTTPKNTATDTKIDNSLCESDGKRVVKFDLNKDGKDDVWRLYAGTVMTCKQDDFDHDGRKDWLAAFDKNGNPAYQKADFDYDGKFDMTTVFDASGKVSEVQRDTDFDGKFDVKEIYADGALSSVRRDRNGDNNPDQWEQYSDNVLTAITYDDDFDGKVDRRDDAPGQPAQPKQEEPAPNPTPSAQTPPVSAPATPAPAKP